MRMRIPHKPVLLKVLGAIAALGLVLGIMQASQTATTASAAIIPTDGSSTPATAWMAPSIWYKLNGFSPIGSSIPEDSYYGKRATVVATGSGLSGPGTDPLLGEQESAYYDNSIWCGGGAAAIKLPDNILSGLTSITVSVNVIYKFSSTQDPQFLWGFGNPMDASGNGNGYLYATDVPSLHAGMTLTNWTGEQQASSLDTLERPGSMHRITFTYDDATHTETLYVDAMQIAQKTSVTINPSQIGGGLTSHNYLGLSEYSSDSPYNGCFNDFRIYSTALSASDITSLVSHEATAHDDAANLTVQDVNDVRGDLYLPSAFPDGAEVSWDSSNPAVISNSGLVHRQSTDTTVTLRAQVQYADGVAERQFTATVKAAPAPLAALAGYVFVYFTGETKQGQSLYLSVSDGNNILRYRTPINNGNPVLTSHFGTGGVRDPSIVRSPDGDTFYLLATDLEFPDAATNIVNWPQAESYGSQYLEIWKSHNLVDWTQQAHTLVSLPTAGDTWAPEGTWDPDINQYVVYWSTDTFAPSDPAHSIRTYNRIMMSTTRDFVNFTTPTAWDDPGANRIDATVTSATDPTTGVNTFYRFTKAISSPLPAGMIGSCREDIMEESSTNLLTPTTPSSEGWTPVSTCISKHWLGGINVEAPIIVKSNPGDVNNVGGKQRYYLYLDRSPALGYIPLVSDSLSNPDWQVVPDGGYTNPIPVSATTTTRHGQILPITAAEMAQLQAGPTTQGVPANSTMLNYNFAENGGTVAHDTTGSGLNATAIGGLTLGNGRATFNGTDGYLLLPNNLLAGQNSVTIDADVKVDPSQTGNYMLYGLGSTLYGPGTVDTSVGQGNGYVFATGSPTLRGAITPSDWTHELSAHANGALPTGQWERVTYVINYNPYTSTNPLTTAIYLNGVLQGSVASQAKGPADINGGWSTDDYIGRSLFSADNYFKGQMKSFTIYNYAFSASQVAALGGP